MSNRPQDPTSNDPEAFSGNMEWLYDTLDEGASQPGPRPRGGLPCGTLLILLFGLLVLGGIAFMLFGPPLPAAEEPTPTPTPTATVVLPTAEPTVTPVIIPTATPPPTPTPEAAFSVGERVIIVSTGAQGVRLRAGAGLDFLTQGIYYDGDPFFVMPNSDPGVDYPVQNDGYTWWRLRAADGLIGWTVEQFLKPAPLVTPTPSVTATP
jgi:hypothetical protein